MRLIVTLCLCVAVASSAFADGRGSAPPPPPSSPSSLPTDRPPTEEEKAAMAQQRAAGEYESAYREITKAQNELAEAATLAKSAEAKDQKKAEEKKKSATKRLTKSAEKLAAVVQLAPKHADAWNILGYSKRMTGDVQGAFEAYWECLRLKPDHPGAHEYLGEAYLQSGKLKEAQAELDWLRKKGATREAETLAASVAAYLEKNPAAAAETKAAVETPGGASAQPAAAAAADTTSK
jgi:tetratricopeptide (TPR) repeat protein